MKQTTTTIGKIVGVSEKTVIVAIESLNCRRNKTDGSHELEVLRKSKKLGTPENNCEYQKLVDTTKYIFLIIYDD